MRLFALSLCLLPYAASAHTLWLEPQRADDRGVVGISLKLGDPLKSEEDVSIGARERYDKALLVGRGGKQELLGALLLKGQPVLLLKDVAASNGQLVVLDSTARESTLPASGFERYLLEERLIDILARRADNGTEEAPGRERYFRCMKALLRGVTPDAAIVTRPVGQELEIVPVEDPRAVKKGTTLRFRILHRGQPLARRSVTAARRDGESIELRRIRTDKDGIATFAHTGKGDWLISLVHMEEETFPGFDWRSVWSTFFFSID